mgnify:CR=1 FL=1
MFWTRTQSLCLWYAFFSKYYTQFILNVFGFYLFNFYFYNYTFTSLWWRHSQPSNGRKSKIDWGFNRQRTGRCFQFSTSLSLHIYKVGSLCFMGVGREASITLNIFVLFFFGRRCSTSGKTFHSLSCILVYIGLLCVCFFSSFIY